MQRTKLLLILLSGTAMCTCGLLYRFGLFDRFNLRSNTFTYECIQCDLDKYQIAFVEEGRKPNCFDLSESNSFRMPDWYGKDHVFIAYNGKSQRINFSSFKLHSWRKVKLHVVLNGNQQHSVHWKVETLWQTNEGSFWRKCWFVCVKEILEVSFYSGAAEIFSRASNFAETLYLAE